MRINSIALFLIALLSVSVAYADQGLPECIVTVTDQQRQTVRFGIDAERLWFYWKEQGDKLAQLAVGELKADYARVPMNCAYEREEGVVNLRAYTDVIIPMMKTFRKYNPEIQFFASPRPLKEAYAKTESDLIAQNFKHGNIGMAAYPVWVGGHKRLIKKDIRGVQLDKWVRYLADYLNLMAEHDLDIAYMDLMNEDQTMWAGKIDNILYVIDSLPSRLNPGVKMPKIVFPSTWSPRDGMTRFLTSPSVIDRQAEVLKKIGVVSTHNTPDGSRLNFKEEDLFTFANAVRSIDPEKELWNTEMHGWVGTRSPAEDILNSVILWRHLEAGFSGIDTWLFFGPWKGAAHPMVYSNRKHGPETTAKYEIYKSLVNDMHQGRYVASGATDARIVSAVLTKDGKMLVSLLNRSDESISVQIKLPENLKTHEEMEIRSWEASRNDPLARVSHDPNFGCKDNWNYELPPESLVHFVFRVTQAEGFEH